MDKKMLRSVAWSFLCVRHTRGVGQSIKICLFTAMGLHWWLLVWGQVLLAQLTFPRGENWKGVLDPTSIQCCHTVGIVIWNRTRPRALICRINKQREVIALEQLTSHVERQVGIESIWKDELIEIGQKTGQPAVGLCELIRHTFTDSF